jgi:hypothetical protein
MRRYVRSHFEHDLGVPRERHRARRARPGTAVNEDRHTRSGRRADDGGQVGLHFFSLQRTIADFVTTRAAMNATSAQLQNPVITDTVNNGINSFIFVLKRGNYLVPARAQPSFPLVDD